MAKKKLDYSELLELGKRYCVDDNPLFISASEQYASQLETIRQMRECIAKDGMMIEHVNVKGDVNADMNPLVSQLPKHIDTANKTLSAMLDIITKLGHERQVGRFADMEE